MRQKARFSTSRKGLCQRLQSRSFRKLQLRHAIRGAPHQALKPSVQPGRAEMPNVRFTGKIDDKRAQSANAEVARKTFR